MKEEDDKDLHNQTEKDVASLSKDMDAFETELYLSGAYDHMNAILEFHPGAGGTEAHDWAGMLFRMYTKYCDSHGFKYKVLDYQEGEEAGISSATLEVMGKNAYGLLKSERGVHRMVRLSPFDAAHSRHTSFASVNVMPELDDSVDVEINPAEITIETYRSSGAKRDIVLLNVGLGFYITGKTETMEDGVKMAQSLIEAKAGLDTLQKFIEVSNA